MKKTFKFVIVFIAMYLFLGLVTPHKANALIVKDEGSVIDYNLGPDNLSGQLRRAESGKNIVVGAYLNRVTLWKYNMDNSIDTSFGSGTGVSWWQGSNLSSNGNDLIKTAGNKYYVIGNYDATSSDDIDSQIILWRFNTNGSIDTTFGGGDGYVVYEYSGGIGKDDRGISLGFTPDSNNIIIGAKTLVNEEFVGGFYTRDYDVVVLKVDLDGNIDTTFGNSGFSRLNIGNDDSINKLLVWVDGKITVAGSSGKPTIWRLNTNGTLDTGFNTNGYYIYNAASSGEFTDQLKASDNKYYLSTIIWFGSYPDSNGVVISLNNNGSLNTDFSSDGIDTINQGAYTSGNPSIDMLTGIAMDSQFKIFVTGTFHNGTRSESFILRYKSNGELDDKFNVTGKVVISDHNAMRVGILVDSNTKFRTFTNYSELVPVDTYNNHFRIEDFTDVVVEDPGDVLTDTKFYYTWYDDSDSAEVIREAWTLVGNPSTTTNANITIRFNGESSPRVTQTLTPGQVITPQFNEEVGGPVIVESDTPIYSSQRVRYKNSFNELVGFPDSGLDDEFFFSWYDDSDGGVIREAWVLVGNPSNSTIYVEVSLDGINTQNITIPANGRHYFQWNEQLGGPVKVNGYTNSGKSTPAYIYTSERVRFADSFNEMMGLSTIAFDTTHYFPWYDDSDSGSTLREAYVLVGNPSPTTAANVSIEIAGETDTNIVIQPGKTYVKQWDEKAGSGPVFINSDIPIYATERVRYKNSFNESGSFIEDNLSKKQYFTWYDDSDSGIGREAWILVGNPNAEDAIVDVIIAGKVIYQGIVPGFGSITAQWDEKVGGPVTVISDSNLFSSSRVRYGESFNELMSISKGD